MQGVHNDGIWHDERDRPEGVDVTVVSNDLAENVVDRLHREDGCNRQPVFDATVLVNEIVCPVGRYVVSHWLDLIL